MAYTSKEDAAAYAKKYAQENKEKIHAYRKIWKAKNKDKTAVYRRRNYLKYQEARKKYANEHRNPARTLLGKKASCANKRYPGKITIKDIDFIIQRDGKKCHWCKKQITEKGDLTLEHLKPVNDVQYLTIACLACNNSRKHLRGGTRPYLIYLTDEQLKKFQIWSKDNGIPSGIKHRTGSKSVYTSLG